MNGLRRSDFDYTLPPELIAQSPLPQRSASRLLLLDGQTAQWQDRYVQELPELLLSGDLLILNDTRVLPARLPARKPSGGRIEIFLERILDGPRALAQLRDSKAVAVGMALHSAGGAVKIIARCGEHWQIELPADALGFFERYGRVPLPPYIRREPDEADRERYQSLWASVPGAVAAPTASLHFDEALLGALRARGIERAWLTLHVGAGTFAPLRNEQLDGHALHAERFSLSEATVAAIRRTRERGGRVVAIGTTVARALESAALGSSIPVSGAGETTLFIHPGFRFQVTDILLTNFHLPQSTLLMLVSAFAGRQNVLGAYHHAIAQRYRFFSYGDAMLVFPQHEARGSA
ncbi:MAG: tRNA preQ1(34) S-adenosylmethionine ribosyltransferase-isomerase QueA [Steroidobacteraceae bacterium]